MKINQLWQEQSSLSRENPRCKGSEAETNWVCARNKIPSKAASTVRQWGRRSRQGKVTWTPEAAGRSLGLGFIPGGLGVGGWPLSSEVFRTGNPRWHYHLSFVCRDYTGYRWRMGRSGGEWGQRPIRRPSVISEQEVLLSNPGGRD